MHIVCQIGNHTVCLSIDIQQPVLNSMPRGAAYTKRQVIVPRKQGNAYGFSQYYVSTTDSIVLSHMA